MNTFFRDLGLRLGVISSEQPTVKHHKCDSIISEKPKGIWKGISTWFSDRKEYNKRICGKYIQELHVDSAIQLLVGKSEDFKQLRKELGLSKVEKPKRALKERCKEVVDKHFQLINVDGLSSKAVKNLHKLVKYSVYSLVARQGEEALPKTASELANVWKNLDFYCFSSMKNNKFSNFAKELKERMCLSEKHKDVNPDVEFRKLSKYLASKVDEKSPYFDLKFSLAVKRFQDEYEKIPRSEPEARTKLVKKLLQHVPAFEISNEMKAILIRKSAEYMKHMPLHMRENTFKMQSQLIDSAKVALLLSINSGKAGSFRDVEREFMFDSKPKLVRMSKGLDVKRISSNEGLKKAARASGLVAVSKTKKFINSMRGHAESTIAIPVGKGKMKHFDKSSAISLAQRHAIATEDDSVGDNIKEVREKFLREMLKDDALLNLTKKRVVGRVRHQVGLLKQFSQRNFNRANEKDLRAMIEQEYLHDAFEDSWEGGNNYEGNHDYEDIMQELLKKYSPEAVKNDPKKYERVMNFLEFNTKQKELGLKVNEIANSGYIASILHRFAA